MIDQKELDDYYKIEIDLFNPKRHQLMFLGFLTFYSFFFALYYATEDVMMVFLPQLPFAILVYFGCYALINIGWHLLILEDCEDAHNELLKDIAEARVFLRSKGMKL